MNSAHEKDFFDLSGSLSFKEQRSLVRWYSCSLVFLVLVIASMLVFSGHALYKNFWSFSSIPELPGAQDSLEEIRAHHAQTVELYKQREKYNKADALQKNHELIANALSCLVQSTPLGVHLDKISLDSNKVTITCLAETSNLCMDFVEKLKNNRCFKEYVVHTITWHPTLPYYRQVQISFVV